jgi:glycosyltransferase involved in cell wall biosynthesis
VAILFSVIIPAYNSEAYIGEAIESALLQEGVNFEIVVVNDGSTDKTSFIAGSFGQRLRVVNQQNMGLSEARNSGARVAVGNVLAFLDSDDVWLPGKLKAQYEKLLEGYRVVYTNRYNIGEIGDLPEIQSSIVKMPEGDIWHELIYGNMITASSSIISKDIYDELGGFRKELRSCEDWDFWLRCSEYNRIGYCSEPLVKYRIHSGGLSKNYRFMNEMRTKVIARALASHRGEALPLWEKKKVVAKMLSISGWEAARAKDLMQSLKYYTAALRSWPFSYQIWYDVTRAVAGRA